MRSWVLFTRLSPLDLLDQLQRIDMPAGRELQHPNAPHADLDLLLHGTLRLTNPASAGRIRARHSAPLRCRWQSLRPRRSARRSWRRWRIRD
jgi:hypothetical protein